LTWQQSLVQNLKVLLPDVLSMDHWYCSTKRLGAAQGHCSFPPPEYSCQSGRCTYPSSLNHKSDRYLAGLSQPDSESNCDGLDPRCLQMSRSPPASESLVASCALSSCTFRSRVAFVFITSQSNSSPRLARSTFQCCTNIPFTTCRTSALRMSYFNLPYLPYPPFLIPTRRMLAQFPSCMVAEPRFCAFISALILAPRSLVLLTDICIECVIHR
jgi:hypothetical protein